jgi:hypothetical protein
MKWPIASVTTLLLPVAVCSRYLCEKTQQSNYRWCAIGAYTYRFRPFNVLNKSVLLGTQNAGFSLEKTQNLHLLQTTTECHGLGPDISQVVTTFVTTKSNCRPLWNKNEFRFLFYRGPFHFPQMFHFNAKGALRG